MDEKIYLHTTGAGTKEMHKWQINGNGTSALPASHIGLLIGYDEVVLCGCPLDDSGHFFDPPWITSRFTREVPTIQHKGEDVLAYWVEASRVWKGRVTSMSGRTKELLNPSA